MESMSAPLVYLCLKVVCVLPVLIWPKTTPAIVDLCFDDTTDPTTGCIAMSRVRCADDILVMQGFDIKLFSERRTVGPCDVFKVPPRRRDGH